MIRFKVNALETLKAVGYNPKRLRDEKLFGEATVQKMRHGQLVSWNEFDRLCRILGVQPGDLIEYVEEVQTNEPGKSR